MKVRRILYIGAIGLLLLFVLIIDVIRKSVDLDLGGVEFLRDVMIIGAFVLAFLVLERTVSMRDQNPVKRMGLALVGSIVMAVVGVGASLMLEGGFDSKNYMLLPLGYGPLFIATLLNIAFGLFAVAVLRLLRDLTLYKRKRSTQRNLLIFIGLMLATSASTISLKPLEQEIYVSVLYGFAIVGAIVNSFRLSWIVYLVKREKVFGLLYGFFLFGVFIVLNILIQSSTVSRALLYYSYPLKEFVSLVCVFGNIYFGMAFVSTLFHLPTAEAFDRKTTELSSLHNLSKLVTQAFDFTVLIDTVTSMTLQVCEAKGCWLELIYAGEEARGDGLPRKGLVVRNTVVGTYFVQIVGMKNTTQDEIDALMPAGDRTVRDAVLEERIPIVVDDIRRDVRLRKPGRSTLPEGSLVVVPLISHADVIGILYATKDTEHGFIKDDVDVISAFADQATLAIENSRLFNKSLERERLIGEMLIAQEMQRKLLPQTLPQFSSAELSASSTPAFEVGGDYYDVAQLDEHRLGIIVGDVSGKGVSAAFYMSEVKGIFQSLSRLHGSPKNFMVKASEALLGSFDKRSFITLIYAIVDVDTGRVLLVRAGHCPLLLVSRGQGGYVRPKGMGIGLGDGSAFSSSIEEETIHLHEGDVLVLYTDGVTEARCRDDEFGYDRLLDAVLQVREQSASAIKEHVLTTIKEFTAQQANHDDLTLVVLKWHGKRNAPQVEVS
jgi:sigma-B regulation protein RsbU (phosphoserine phosphatase)